MPMSQYVRTIAPIALLGILLAACGQQAPSAPAAAEATTVGSTTAPAPASSNTAALKVVATTSIIADMVANVGGDRIALTTLLPADSDPHTYSPRPEDTRAIAEAQIVFANGVGLEEWLEELMTNAGGERPIIMVSDGLEVLEGSEHDHADEGEEHSDSSEGEAMAEGEEHEHEAGDPHMWFDVQNAIHYTEQIRDGLVEADKTNAATYQSNADAYIAKLRALDSWIKEQVATIPAERRKLVTSHDTFAYFAHRYGFEIVGTVFEGVSTEQEPSAQELVQLVERIRKEQVPAIFTENTINSRLAEQVASEAGVTVVTQLYTDSLGPAGSNGDSYEKMMRANVQILVDVLPHEG